MRVRYLPLAVMYLLLAYSAAARPMTWKDVGLMLRAGYSSESVSREAATRRVIEPLDPVAEKMLVEAGANPALIQACRTGTFGVPPEDLAKAQQQLESDAKRRELQAAESRKFNTLYQAELARARSAAPPPVPGKNIIHEALKGDLVHLKGTTVDPYDDTQLAEKKIFAIYFSAYWCGPCRKFTPQLAEYYNRVAKQHPEFELIFFSSDRSQFGMDTYMKENKMPWPAVAYTKRDTKEALKKYAGKGIPCLVLVDAQGNVLSHSYNGEEYIGPEKVIADLDKFFAQTAVAQASHRQ